MRLSLSESMRGLPPTGPKPGPRRSIHPLTLIAYLVIGLFCLFELVPLCYVVLSGFKTNTEINRVTFFPSHLRLQNYTDVFASPLVIPGFVNSLIIIVGSLLIGVMVSALAGYALSRWRGIFSLAIYLVFLSAFMIPNATNLATTYALLQKLGLLDSRAGLIMIYAAGTIPFGVLLYAGFVKTIPRELDEAAMIDGCGFFRRFYYVVFPLLRPAVVTHIVLNVIGIWNDFLTPLVYITSDDKKPLPLAMFSFVSNHATDWGAIFALLTLSMIPPLLFFLIAQKYIYQALTQGVVKG